MMEEPPERLLLDRLRTPIGEALLVCDGAGRLRALEWADQEARLWRSLRLLCGHGADAGLESGQAPASIIRPLAAYFAGDLSGLETIECCTGGTPFQQTVWTALRSIPAGQTLSYGAFAANLGAPRAVRAVGHANGANPISVVVPCHRLIGADGTLTGYGGGLERKRWLLTHEGVALSDRAGPRP